MFPLSKPAFQLFQQSLDATALRQKVISNNIANEDTPYFKRSDVAFEELLQKEMSGFTYSIEGKRTDPRHIPIGRLSASNVKAEVQLDENTAMNNNQNNVDIDYEMVMLAKNQLRTNTLIEQLNYEFRSIRAALDGRR